MTLNASSKLSKPKHATAWRFRDAITVFVVPVLAPVGLVLLLRIWSIMGLLPSAWSHFFAREDPFATAVQYAVVLAVYGLLIVWLCWRRKANLADLGWRKFRSRWLVVTIGAYVAQILLVILAFAAVKALWPQISLDDKQEVFEFGLSGWGYALSFVSTVLVAPAVEETIFRGIMFPALGRKLPIWLAAVISSAAFAILHGQLSVGIYTFLLGLILCWMARKSHSIIPGVMLHFLNNLIAFLLLSAGK